MKTMTTKPKLSVAIPTSDFEDSEMFFKRCLDSLWNQTFQDFEIVVTDDSTNDRVREICEWYRTGIKYFKNPTQKGMAGNTNEAITRSKGKFIKLLYMDDYLAHDLALENIINSFQGEWLVTGCIHVYGNDDERFNKHMPFWSENIHTGNNTIGSPSVLTIKNNNPLLFDEKMTWLLDVDLYKRYYEKYGEPTILDEVNVVIGLHRGQATHTMGNERKLQEAEYIKQKYE